ncbi:hypothetical protein ABEF95_015680 [Exophiala dermatitidis]
MELQELHDRYGPVIRISPDELHIRDSDYYEELYAPGAKKRDKYAGWVAMAGAPTSSFATTGEVIRLDVAYMALTTDIISHACFGES